MLLGLLATGLGQLHSGRVKRAFAILLINALALPVLLWIWSSAGGALPATIALLLLSLGWVIGCLVDAARCAGSGRLLPGGRLQRVLLYACYAVAFHLAMSWEQDTIKKHWLRAFHMPSGSMEPTLMAGDYLVAGMGDAFVVGDVVVFRRPGKPEEELVKRIVAGPGSAVEVRDGAVLVNGHPASPTGGDSKVSFAVQVRDTSLEMKEDEFFMLGDDPANSLDSRHFGPVKRDAVLGRVLFLYLSVDRQTGTVRWDRIGVPIESRGAAGT